MPELSEIKPTEAWLTQPGGIAETLRTIRMRARLTGVQLAEENGWASSKISKLETGRQVPTEEDIRAWLASCGAEDQAPGLLAQLDHLQVRYRDWRRRVRLGQATVQAGYNDLVRDSEVFREFSMTFVPGLIQTAEYARYPLTVAVDLHGAPADEVDAAVAVRMQRQQYLYDKGKRFEFLLDEPVLLRGLCPADVMRDQLDRLHTVVGLRNVRFGILPLRKRLTIAPQNGFAIVDDKVLVEGFGGEFEPEHPDALSTFSDVMDRLWENAATGSDARRLITEAADALPWQGEQGEQGEQGG